MLFAQLSVFSSGCIIEAALALNQELRKRFDIAACFAGLAVVAAVDGKSERAARLLGASEALLKTIGATVESSE